MKRLLFSIFTMLAPLVVPAQQSQRLQYVVFQVTPKIATVTIDGKSVATDRDGIAVFTLNNGTYEYTISANEYHSKSGYVNVAGEKVVKNVQLSYTCGWLNIPSSEKWNGARVYINDALIGEMPIKSYKLTSGTYSIRITHDKYKVFDSQIAISEGKTLEYTPSLTPRMGTLNVQSTPAMADVYVDDKLVGQTPLMVDLIIGEHEVSVCKRLSRDDTQRVSINEDCVTDVNLVLEELVDGNQPFAMAEQLPSFNGGDIRTFQAWVQREVRYPMIAQENNITGRVDFSFVVEKDGSLGQIKVLQSPDQSLADEIVRVLKSSPKWVPGKQGNEAVSVKFSSSIYFQCQ